MDGRQIKINKIHTEPTIEHKSHKNGGRKFIISIFIFLIFFLGLFSYRVYVSGNYFSFSYNAKESISQSEVKILIFGDMMLDRNVRNVINKIGFDEFFKDIQYLVRSADISVVNLEGPFTTYPSITADRKNKTLQFTFDPALAPKLATFGFDILGLANNHTLNFGRSGLEQTRRYIGNVGMIYYGEPLNKDEISTVVTRNGIRIAFVGFHEFNYVNFENVFAEIARLRPDVDVLIVTPHWGVEYQKEPTAKMTEWAQKFIDSGADMVIGTHPHIVGDVGVYKGKKIYYSLGNFVFDQYFSEDTMKGLAVSIDIEKINDLSGKQPGKVNIDYIDIPLRIDRDGVRVDKKLQFPTL